MEICVEILLISLSILLIAKAAKTVAEAVISILLSDLCVLKNEEEAVEEPLEEVPVKLRYDVDGFKSRMAKMRDADGLYDIPPSPPRTDFTGTEVVTDNYEIEADRLIGR